MAERWQAPSDRRARAAQVRRGYAFALVGVALTSCAIAAIHTHVRIPNISILYLFVILALASTIGRRPALLAAFLAFLSYNFLFVEPLYTFAIHDPDQWLALLVFLVTALVAGQLTAALREQAEEARRRERVTATLYELSRALVAKQEPERLLAAVAAQVVAVFGARACTILLPDQSGRLRPRIGSAADGGSLPTLGRDEERFVDRIFTDDHGSGPERYGPHLYVPLHTGGRRLGVLRIDSAGTIALQGEADGQLLATFAAQAALALEQARLEREAIRAEVLARSDRLKDALLSSVSHDLRTPLAAIRAAAGSLLQEEIDWDSEARREFAAAIDEEAARLNRLVGALLDMSRIEAGALRARKEYYPLDALIRAAVARLAPLAEGRLLEIDLPAALPPVPLDPVQIDQVLGNLLENALKYSPGGTPITVAAAVQSDAADGTGEVIVSVADRGPGIAPDARTRVFAKFSRLRQAEGVPGSGLGLAIARGLIEAHSGRIWVENQSGGGARFSFSLPLPPPMGWPPERVAARPGGHWDDAEPERPPQTAPLPVGVVPGAVL